LRRRLYPFAVLRHRTPDAPLSKLIEHIWLFDGTSPAHAKERVLPSGTVQLIIDLSSRREPIVVGPRSEHMVIETAGRVSMLGVHFKPGGAFPFFGLPASELHNLDVPLDRLWGPRGRDLASQIVEAPTPEAKFGLVERTLLDTARAFGRHPAVAFALREFQQVPLGRSIGDVTDESGLSQRRFIERFKHEVGLSPKLYCRVRRFQAVVARVHAMGRVDWADLAAGCGYFDQAHLIHDFRAFSGLTPERYLGARTEYQNHVVTAD
jgi:AraC-like DNA-binding protein